VARRRKLWSRFSVAGILPVLPAAGLGRERANDRLTRQQIVELKKEELKN
jgi:hypothetical protein